jgi:hypothetical protein
MEGLESLVASDAALAPRFDALHRVFVASLLEQEKAPAAVRSADPPPRPRRAALRRAAPRCAALRRAARAAAAAAAAAADARPLPKPPPLSSRATQAAAAQDGRPGGAQAVLLAALLRWGGDGPLSVQAVLSAYTAAALRVARHAAAHKAAPPEPEACGDDAAAARRRDQALLRARVGASLVAAEAAVRSLQGLAADARLLDAACAPLGPRGSWSQAAAAAGAEPRGPAQALRAFWLDPEQGLRLVAAAGAAAAGSPAGCRETADAMAAATAAAAAAAVQGAAAVGSVAQHCERGGTSGQGTAVEAAAGAPRGAAAAQLQQLACALLLQPRWPAFCSLLAAEHGRLDAPAGEAAATAEGATSSGSAEDTGNAAAEGAAALARAVADGLARALAQRLPDVPAAALAAACWAQPRMQQACLEMLAAEECVAAAAASAEVAAWLERLVGMLEWLGCLAC